MFCASSTVCPSWVLMTAENFCADFEEVKVELVFGECLVRFHLLISIQMRIQTGMGSFDESSMNDFAPIQILSGGQ